MAPDSSATLVPAAELARVAFEDAYVQHREQVYLWALRFSGGRGAWAEDLTHDVFLQLHRHLPRVDLHELGRWLYRVTANLALGRLRRERSWVGQLERFVLGREAPPGPDEALSLRGQAAEALRLLASLPPKERVVLTMLVLDGQAQRDIARALGFSEGYVSKLLGRAWAAIRAAGWEVDDGP